MYASSLINNSETFAEYLGAWQKFLVENNTKDWADEEDDDVSHARQLSACAVLPKPIIVFKQIEKPIENSLPEVNEFTQVKRKTKKVKKATETRGKLLKWIPHKNYGFVVSPKYPGTQIFCHRSNFIGNPIIGGNVVIEIGTNWKGVIVESARHV